MIGNRIKELRKSKKMSQSELGKFIGVSQTTVTAWENGRAEPSSSYVAKLATFFNVSTDYLLGRKTPDNNDIDLDRAIDNAMSFDGKPVTDHDRKIMKQLWKAYMAGKE
ncbi:helix-turn-helix domain-containing protein [Limosilactobacillus mucosae]|uniref:helix-turn-helix domain-containing protein n=1 Tax=Limosilactobacillus mucosae TaxID=97478 RepID=UPI000EC57194|nr:helix-turn-helix transcriptional regulator [Limosilactobacillus mucosae]HAM86288.1 XRE family transcriptional regulator [Lactobacillus sp.]